jgi:mRNA interferase MazF
VRFPFSNLSQSKVRPAVCLARASRADWILAQITSKEYGDRAAIKIIDQDFASGGLKLDSFVRPGKLFTCEQSLLIASVGALNDASLRRILDAVVKLFQASRP